MEVAVKPLSGKSAEGKPYTRPAGVEAEIEAVLEWPLPKAFALAAEGRLKPQTLVYLMRNCRPNRRNPHYDQLVVAFLSRIERSGDALTKGLSVRDREWVDERVKDKALELIAIDRLDIFEMSFKTGAERLYLTAISAMRLRRRTEISREDLVPAESEATGEEIVDALTFAHDRSLPMAEVKAILGQVLKKLTEKERLAVFYVYQMGLTEAEAGDQMHCTDRNVRYLLKNVRRKALGEAQSAQAGVPERVKP
jgi:RNA polymerase sigma factor (sigma-70 family)